MKTKRLFVFVDPNFNSKEFSRDFGEKILEPMVWRFRKIKGKFHSVE